jgi:transposase InsO family protein
MEKFMNRNVASRSDLEGTDGTLAGPYRHCRERTDHEPGIASNGHAPKKRRSMPMKPQQNPYIESFNVKFRDECLNEHWFLSMRHARQVIAAWRQEYNGERPHSSLGYLTPNRFTESFFTADSMLVSD